MNIKQDMMGYIAKYGALVESTKDGLYRKKLKTKLLKLRADKDLGAILSHNFLDKEKKTEQYIISHFGYTIKSATHIIDIYDNESVKGYKGGLLRLCKNIAKFPLNIHKEIALKMSKVGGWTLFHRRGFDGFQGLDAEVFDTYAKRPDMWKWIKQCNPPFEYETIKDSFDTMLKSHGYFREGGAEYVLDGCEYIKNIPVDKITDLIVEIYNHYRHDTSSNGKKILHKLSIFIQKNIKQGNIPKDVITLFLNSKHTQTIKYGELLVKKASRIE